MDFASREDLANLPHWSQQQSREAPNYVVLEELAKAQNFAATAAPLPAD
jgi:hypothetical protein